MNLQKANQLWYNGQIIPWDDANIHVMSHILHYGSGVFEGIRCYEVNGKSIIFRLDDHIQRIGLVTRGEDLVNATHIHKIIQVLLGLNSPKYLHHPLILDSNGIRLSKRTRAQTVKSLKASGLKKEDIIDLLGKENILSLLSLIK